MLETVVLADIGWKSDMKGRKSSDVGVQAMWPSRGMSDLTVNRGFDGHNHNVLGRQ